MSIITISRGSYSMGKAVAEKVAERLKYDCISRDVLLEASDQFDIPEIQLAHAIQDAPSILEKFTHGRDSYVAYIRCALLRHVCWDNLVYHGLAGHLLLTEMPHLLRIRIIADLELRISTVMERKQLSRQDAETSIHKIDNERRKWTKSLYGVDPTDPALYDLLLNVPRFGVDDAADLICHAVQKEQFQSSAESQRVAEDLALACQIKAALLPKHADVSVSCKNGNVVIYCSERHARKVKEDVRRLSIDGINNIEVHEDATPPDDAV